MLKTIEKPGIGDVKEGGDALSKLQSDGEHNPEDQELPQSPEENPVEERKDSRQGSSPGI